MQAKGPPPGQGALGAAPGKVRQGTTGPAATQWQGGAAPLGTAPPWSEHAEEDQVPETTIAAIMLLYCWPALLMLSFLSSTLNRK